MQVDLYLGFLNYPFQLVPKKFLHFDPRRNEQNYNLGQKNRLRAGKISFSISTHQRNEPLLFPQAGRNKIMFLPAWRNNSGSFLWCVDMEKPYFSRSKSVFLTQSTRQYSELNFAKPEEKSFPGIPLGQVPAARSLPDSHGCPETT